MFYALSILWNTTKILVVVVDSALSIGRHRKSIFHVDENRRTAAAIFIPLTVHSHLSDLTDSFPLSPDQHGFSQFRRNTSSSGLSIRTISAAFFEV